MFIYLFIYAVCCQGSYLSPHFTSLNEGLLNFRTSAALSVSCWHCCAKSISHPDMYLSTTLIYQVQNVPSRCSAADISEL